jgi:putative tryptophan/tyrosine transport system substrate-binding protein
MPAMWGHRQFVEAGGLMSYAVNYYDQLRRAAGYKLAINLTAAKTIGLRIPQSLLSRADQVIE